MFVVGGVLGFGWVGCESMFRVLLDRAPPPESNNKSSLLSLPAGGELLVSLFKAVNDLIHIKLAMSMIN